MSFFALLCALLLEQVRPLARNNPIHVWLRAWARWASRNFDAGSAHHGWVAWGLAAGVPSLVALGVHWALLWFLGWPFATLWSVAVLYTTLGFRQFSHHFTGIRDALDAGDERLARELLAQWQQVDVGDLPRSEIVRHVIEYSVLAAHRHVFGVLAWFSVLAAFGLGPAGAVFYRMSEFVARYWRHKITALGFAVVGSFEEAIDGWRNHAQRFPEDNDGVILAATAGAVNVRLGGEALKEASFAAQSAQTFEAHARQQDSESTPGRVPELSHLRSIVGLVWRSVVMWMVLLALLTLARLLG
jgi:adenosylcobinamide-phosphate synthase